MVLGEQARVSSAKSLEESRALGRHLSIRSGATATGQCEAVVLSVGTAEACRFVTPLRMVQALLTT
jgi:hypothetical protein